MPEIKNFGRFIEVVTPGKTFRSDSYNIEAEIPFDDDPLPNESEIRIWNLADTTIKGIKKGSEIVINAGYRTDVGTILRGVVSFIQTVPSGAERITVINVMDAPDVAKQKAVSIAFKPGTLASTILKQLAAKTGLQIAQFDLVQDVRYLGGYTVKGKPTEELAKVADDCKTTVFVNKRRLYFRPLRRGGDSVFDLSVDTGLIGTPEYFEGDHAKGYNVTMQLQHRVTTASVINIDSSVFKGKVHARSGKHTLTRTGDFITEVEGVI